MSGRTAIKLLEQLWNRDLSAYDPEGLLPEVDPLDGENTSPGAGRACGGSETRSPPPRSRRELADAKHLSIRQLMIEVSGRQSFVGSPATIAESMERFVQEGASDGFILVPHVTPGGWTTSPTRSCLSCKNGGSFRTEYEGPTCETFSALESSPRARPFKRIAS